MYVKIFKIFKYTVGIVLIVIGVIGLFLPIIQGILLIIAGLLLMGVKKEQIKKWFKKLKFRHSSQQNLR
ncbi:hypothetical protein HYX02_03680 [Candidatus Woesearchaeota archaeon]|nr:hypothetical protein [Candidatus Woesearchaeota archaeon]